MKKLLLIASLLVLGLTGCGANRSCSFTSRAAILCIDMSGSAYGTNNAGELACTGGGLGTGGTFATSACAKATIGSCKYFSGQATEMTYNYYTGYSGTASALEDACTAGTGSWTGA